MDDKIILEKLNGQMEVAVSAANSLCDALAAIGSNIDIKPAEEMTDEDKKKFGDLAFECDSRRAYILKGILIRYGNLLFL